MSKTWFITGASSGLGEALSKAVLAAGDAVVATFRKQEQAEAFNREAKENGLGLVLDVTHTEDISRALETAKGKFGRLDVLVNNAGYGTIGAIEEFSLQEIREQMETNFFGAVAVTKAALPILREQGGGHIIQISSQSGFRASAGFGVYNASKFALEGFSEALAQEVQPFGIKVVIVEPGPFRTQFLGSSVKTPQETLEPYKNTPVAQMYQYMQRMNGKQEGDPEKAARAIVDYIHNNREPLRLPLGKTTIQGMRAKLASVEKDIAANEAISISTVFEN
ncbi:MAG TPA: oxidoreductase [Flavisolibacter sp.]|nr:oxidoreductase [Flavisolibacter sp.]